MAQEAEALAEFSAERIQKNAMTLYKIRQFTAILTGCLAGLVGWTGLHGIGLYVVSCFTISLYIAYTMKFNVTEYFTKTSELFDAGAVTGGALSFILFWTLVYDSIWIF
uniref:ER membrane protein complex subunit 6 n=1 Tax=Eutreptiella gymnastica TaxID=73025 RepID=A0A7S1NCK9_9EUGL